MLGFLIGTVCLIGLIKTLRWGRRHGGWGHGGWGHGYGGGWGHHGGGCGGGYARRRWGGGWGGPEAWGDDQEDQGWGGGWGGPSVMLRGLYRRLETTPGQEKVIAQAIDEVREAARQARGEVRAARADIAKAMRSPAIDEVLFGEMFARHDTALESLRKATVGALAKVHDALDEKQRARLADLIESGPRFRGGPWSAQASL